MIDFSNASILSYTHTPQFLGENLRYKITKNLSIQGWILNPDFTGEGVDQVYNQINQLLSGVNDYDDIVLNGYDLGEGKILSFNFERNDANKDVLYKKFNATIEVYDSGNLFNALSGYYSGLTWNNSNALASFSENFSYTRSQDDVSQYSQNIALRFNSGHDLPDTPINMAKVFASGFFEALNLTGLLGLSYNKFYRQYLTETYNLIDNSVSFRQDVEFPQESGLYAVTYSHSYELSENGIITVGENGSLKGLFEPLKDTMYAGLNNELPQAWNRCSGIFAVYAPSGAYQLNQNPTKKNVTVNRFEGTASFDIEFTNDPKYQTTYLWEYTTTIDISTDRVYTVTENGKVEGIGRRLLDRYPHAASGYQIVKSGISGRVLDTYNQFNPYPLNLNLVSTIEGFSFYQGNVSYSQTFSDNITLFPTSGIRQCEISISDKIPTQATNRFNILGVKELIQPTNQSTLGERTIDVQMVGNRYLPLANYLSYASGQLSGFKNIGTDIWTSNVNYKIDPMNNKFSMNLIYNYDGAYKSFTDVIFSNSGIS
jgi:hypothetical protein